MRHFNRESRDYQFIDKFEAGLALSGGDAKSLRTQPPQFRNSHVEIRNGTPLLVNLHIPPYKYATQNVVDTTQDRPLLLKKREIAKLISYRNQKYMIIPIAIYLAGKWFKVELGIGRKQRKYEKREKIRKREIRKGLT